MGRTSDARQRLMDAAYDLIWEHSYGAVTIDAICDRAGVKKGSFYYFFDSKSELALAAINAWWTIRRKVMEDLFRSDIPPLERIRGYLDFMTSRQLHAYETTGHMLGCPLFTLGAEICTQDESIRARIHQILIAVFGLIEQAVADAQAAGEIEGHDASHKARMVLCYYEGVLTRARIENDPEHVRNLSHDALQMIGGPSTLSLA